MTEASAFKCPQCSGSITFDISLQKMKCPYCDTVLELKALKAYERSNSKPDKDDFKWDTTAGGQWSEGEQNDLCIYTCSSCGGEIIGDKTLAASKCPYCDSSVVMDKQFSGDLRPDYVIPFKLDKAAAKDAFKRHLLDKKLLPMAFKDENHIDEIKGVYVPFWLFDVSLEASIDYKGERHKSVVDDDFLYVSTDAYLLEREGSMSFETIPIDGSSKMSNDLMESLEPFDFDEAVEFRKEYLAGYMAQRYDVDVAGSIEDITRRVKGSAEEAFIRNAHKYDSLVPERSSVTLKDSSAKYALYPIWLLHTTWNGKQYTFAMNGQSGKFVGNLPMDENLYKKMKKKLLLRNWGVGLAAVIVIGAVGTMLMGV